MAIRSPGLEKLDKPVVLVFPEVTVCLDCGFVELYIGGNELQTLRDDTSSATGAT
jgi:hypothetical protein